MKISTIWLQLIMSFKKVSTFGTHLIFTLFVWGTFANASEILSPRLIETKYGTLQGILLNLKSETSSKSTISPTSNTNKLKQVEVFLGVPYAKPPIGSLRFMPPVTPTYWKGVKLANKFNSVCYQKMPEFVTKSVIKNLNSSSANYDSKFNRLPEGRVEHLKRLMPFLQNQNENCLYLNIYIPFNQDFLSSSTIKLPVVVFIHGESYDWGTGNTFDGSILSSFGNIILITINYRLGLFGFLSAVVDGSIRGNYGLMDQVAALHWVQENIADFGGDTSNVTIMGHGHGAACVNLLMISPMATNLFTRVILMSGSALAPWALAHESDIYTRHLAKVTNCPLHDNINMIDCLRKKPAEELLKVDFKVPQHLSAFGPIVDGIVVPSKPKDLLIKVLQPPISSSYSSLSSYSSTFSSSTNFGEKSIDNYPLVSYDLLFGITRVESPFVFTNEEEINGIHLSRRDKILRTLIRNLFDYHQQIIFSTLINEYKDWNRPIEHPIDLFDSLVDILGDALIVAPLIQTGDANTRLSTLASKTKTTASNWYHHISNSRISNPASSSSSSSASASFSSHTSSKTKSFFYVYYYQTESNGFSSRLGCRHGEELAYIFGAPLAKDMLNTHLGYFSPNYTHQEAVLSEAVMTYWTNFIKFGDPNIWSNSDDFFKDRSKGRFESIYWPQYDTTQRKYFMITMKPKVKEHYHSHRLSYLLNLLPSLQNQPEIEEASYYFRHHMLHDHENLKTYDGIVRQISFRLSSSSPIVKSSKAKTNEKVNQIDPQTICNEYFKSSRNQREYEKTVIDSKKIDTDATLSADGVAIENDYQIVNKTQATPIVMEQNSYSTALSVTIAIGCSLLILNMLIFAGVYYQLDKAKDSKPKLEHGQHIRTHESCDHLSEEIAPKNQSMQFISDKGSSYIIQRCDNSKIDLSEDLNSINKVLQGHYQYHPNYNSVKSLNGSSVYDYNKINCENVNYTELEKDEGLSEAIHLNSNFQGGLKVSDEEVGTSVYQSDTVNTRCQPPCCAGQCIKLSTINNISKSMMVNSSLSKQSAIYNPYGNRKGVSEVINESNSLLIEDETVA